MRKFAKKSKKVKTPPTSLVTIKNKDIKGNPEGKYLFTVVTIDADDSEDTTTQLWRANSEDQLYKLVKKEYIGDSDDFMGDELSNKFDDDFGFNILVKKVGKF